MKKNKPIAQNTQSDFTAQSLDCDLCFCYTAWSVQCDSTDGQCPCDDCDGGPGPNCLGFDGGSGGFHCNGCQTYYDEETASGYTNCAYSAYVPCNAGGDHSYCEGILGTPPAPDYVGSPSWLYEDYSECCATCDSSVPHHQCNICYTSNTSNVCKPKTDRTINECWKCVDGVLVEDSDVCKGNCAECRNGWCVADHTQCANDPNCKRCKRDANNEHNWYTVFLGRINDEKLLVLSISKLLEDNL